MIKLFKKIKKWFVWLLLGSAVLAAPAVFEYQTPPPTTVIDVGSQKPLYECFGPEININNKIRELKGKSIKVRNSKGRVTTEEFKKTKKWLKGCEITKRVQAQTIEREKYKIQITKIEPRRDGMQVFARAWTTGKPQGVFEDVLDKNGEFIKKRHLRTIPADTQMGFGRDGSIDIERFVFVNPPVLVDDPQGSIVREWTDDITGELHTRTLREDPQEAILQALEHTLKVKKQKFDNSKIVKGKIGNTTTTVYPDADPESTSVDGDAFQTTNASWSTMQGGAGEKSNDSGTLRPAVRIESSATTDVYETIERGIFVLPTSSIPDGDTISSATFSLYENTNSTNTWTTNTFGINIYSSAPASDTAVAAGDYNSLGTTEYSTTIDYSSWSSNAYNDFALNSSGLSAIDATGVSKFGAREANYDAPNTTPTFQASKDIIFHVYMADQTGTANDPKLVIEHSAGGGAAEEVNQSQFW